MSWLRRSNRYRAKTIPPGTVSAPDTEPVPLSEARGKGLAIGVDASLCGGALCFDRDGPSMLAPGPRFGALSDAGPQPASAPQSIRLRSSTHRVAERCRDGCSRGLFSDFSDNADDEGIKQHGSHRIIFYKKYLLDCLVFVYTLWDLAWVVCS